MSTTNYDAETDLNRWSSVGRMFLSGPSSSHVLVGTRQVVGNHNTLSIILHLINIDLIHFMT